MHVLWSFAKFESEKFFYSKYSFDYESLVEEVQKSYKRAMDEQHPVYCAKVEEYDLGIPDDTNLDAEQIGFCLCNMGMTGIEITGIDEDDEPTRKFILIEDPTLEE